MLTRTVILATLGLILLVAPAASADMCQGPPNPNQLACKTPATNPDNDVGCVGTVVGYGEAVANWLTANCRPPH